MDKITNLFKILSDESLSAGVLTKEWQFDQLRQIVKQYNENFNNK